MNTQFLLTGGPALEKILIHLRDSPGRPLPRPLHWCVLPAPPHFASPLNVYDSRERPLRPAGRCHPHGSALPSSLIPALSDTTQLLGVDDETIIQEYALATVGLQPVLPLFVQRFSEE